MVVVVDGGPGIRKYRRELLSLFMVRFFLLDIEIVGGLRTRLGDEWFMFIVHRRTREETKHGRPGWTRAGTRTRMNVTERRRMNERAREDRSRGRAERKVERSGMNLNLNLNHDPSQSSKRAPIASEHVEAHDQRTATPRIHSRQITESPEQNRPRFKPFKSKGDRLTQHNALISAWVTHIRRKVMSLVSGAVSAHPSSRIERFLIQFEMFLGAFDPWSTRDEATSSDGSEMSEIPVQVCQSRVSTGDERLRSRCFLVCLSSSLPWSDSASLFPSHRCFEI